MRGRRFSVPRGGRAEASSAAGPPPDRAARGPRRPLGLEPLGRGSIRWGCGRASVAGIGEGVDAHDHRVARLERLLVRVRRVGDGPRLVARLEGGQWPAQLVQPRQLGRGPLVERIGQRLDVPRPAQGIDGGGQPDS